MTRSTTAVILVPLLLMLSCSGEDSQVKNQGEPLFAALLPWNDSQEVRLYISAPKNITGLEISTTLGKQTRTVATEEFGTTSDRRLFVTQEEFEGFGGMVLAVTPRGAAAAGAQNIHLADLLQVPEFGTDATRRFVVLATEADGLAVPRDLEFNPAKPGELWIVNKGSEGVVIIKDAGEKNQLKEKRHDAYADHFMAKVSSVAFAENGFFATCHESRNEAAGNVDFMGPTLWTSDLAIFAAVNQSKIPGATCGNTNPDGKLAGSHMDMLHQSPLCMGIAHASANSYWVFDGKAGNIVHYDFVKDHGPGASDHSDGKAYRYPEAQVQRVEGVPSHMAFDQEKNWLYIADTGNGKISRLNVKSGKLAGKLPSPGEAMAEYASMSGATFTTFAEGLRQPSGLVIHEGRLFVADHATGEIIAYDLATAKELGRLKTDAQALMGLAISPTKKLWYVDAKAGKVVKITP